MVVVAVIVKCPLIYLTGSMILSVSGSAKQLRHICTTAAAGETGSSAAAKLGIARASLVEG